MMRPIPTILARAETALGEWVLRRHDDEPGRPVYEIIANGAFLMDSSDPSTERALAELTMPWDGARVVLVGGLGLGFTLQAVLARPDVERAVVAEVAEPLLAWGRGPLAALLAEPLADARVEVRLADVIAVAREMAGQCDAVLLDVDNGPDFLVHVDNANIYESAGQAVLRRALRPGGRLGIWSSTRAETLAERLQEHFATVVIHELIVTRRGKAAPYFVLVASA